MTPDHGFRDYRHRRVTVMGLGSFGGGVGAVRFLTEHGAVVTVTDLRQEAQLAEAIAELRATPPARWILGRHDDADFTDAELIVVNPAIRRDHQLLQLAAAHSIPLTSELNLCWQHLHSPIVAVTGSNGKSTTTALLHAILGRSVISHGSTSPLSPVGRGAGGEGDVTDADQNESRLEDEPGFETATSATSPASGLRPPSPSQGEGKRVWLGGNIGRSLLPVVDQIRPDDIVVLELSSFQLTDLDRLQVSPQVSVITNFSPNHLDWHDTLDHYRWAKQTMLRWQSAADVAVLNADDPDVGQWPTNGQRLLFGLHDHGHDGTFLRGEVAVWRHDGIEQEFPLRQWLKLPGRHNLANALAATAAARAMGATLDHVRLGLEQYEPLPHRLQFVGEVAGRRFYNDSLATTPESAIVGIDAFTEPVVLLAGGYDKHVDLTDMARHIARTVKAVALMGQTAKQLQAGIEQSPVAKVAASEPLPDFPTSFQWAWDHSEPGDVILLSPGCASYDWFRNFADRGEQFRQLVEALRSTCASSGSPKR